MSQFSARPMFSSRGGGVPRGEEVASFASYAEAQHAVDSLSDEGFPVQCLTIIGTDLRQVERIRLSRGLREFGTCLIRRADDTRCVLAFSRHLFFPGNEENLVNVIGHEMLHACLPYGEGHGTHFRFFLRKLNEALGLSLAVHSAETAIHSLALRYRYRVTCGACGSAFCYLRAGAIVRHPGRYRCARCGASAFTVETLR